MSTKVLNRKTVMFEISPAGTPSESFYLPVTFKPDEFIVRYISYKANPAEATVTTFVNTNFAQDLGPIASFFDGVQVTPQSVHLISPAFDQYTDIRFTFTDVTGALDTSRNGVLSLLIEFIEYVKEK